MTESDKLEQRKAELEKNFELLSNLRVRLLEKAEKVQLDGTHPLNYLNPAEVAQLFAEWRSTGSEIETINAYLEMSKQMAQRGPAPSILSGAGLGNLNF